MLKVGSWDYFVPQAYYNMVITNGEWSQYQNYIFPESGKTDDQISLVFDPRGGSFKNGTSTFDSDCRKKNVYVLEEKTGETVNVSFYMPEKKGFHPRSKFWWCIPCVSFLRFLVLPFPIKMHFL